jgi:peptidoglycan/LPS O-acetylase OafA/YrhL
MQSNVFTDTRKHYVILDGLRGVAAIVVVMFHIFEIFSGGNHLKQIINHGYLAVDFFFLLSGFVIAHAYDDRWNKMTTGGFFKRRLIRLHPMIVMGMLVGAALFYWSDSPVLFANIQHTPVWKLVVITLAGMLLIPVPVSLDIRGWQEMYPTNGPAWTLFFEYIANILYAFVFRKLSTTVLFVLVVIAGAALIHLGVTSKHGDVIGGWTLNGTHLRIGFTRLLFPFLAGLLLYRFFKPMNIRHAFIWCSLLLVGALAFPRVGGENNLWANGLYDSLTIMLVFPFIVFLGASGTIGGKGMNKICSFLGDISYPLYITHFPMAYVFYGWVFNKQVTMKEAWPVGVLVLVVSILFAYVIVRFYDIPVRKWLGRLLMTNTDANRHNGVGG